MDPDQVAAMDQAAAGLSQVAPAVAALYKGLRSEELAPIDAAFTAAAWLVLEMRASRDEQ